MPVDQPQLEELFLRMYQTATQEWPARWVPLSAYMAFLEDRRARLELSMEEWSAQSGDLYLVCACLLGTREAIAALTQDLSLWVPPMLAGRFRLEKADRDDIFQELLRHLLVAVGDKPPRLSSYAGIKRLRSWLTVIAFNKTYSWLESHHGHRDKLHAEVDAILESLASDQLVGTTAPDIGQQEWVYVKQLCRNEWLPVFKAAFRAAFEKLEMEERFLLRMWLIDKFTQEQIGRRLGRDHSAVSRRIRRLSKRLQVLVHQELGAYGLEISDAQELLALLRSQIDLSLPRLLADESAGRS